MRIGDAAATLGLTPRALRFYEEQGLIAVRRTASGQREYDQHDLDRLRMVRALLSAGLTVNDVTEFMARLDLRAKGLASRDGLATSSNLAWGVGSVMTP